MEDESTVRGTESECNVEVKSRECRECRECSENAETRVRQCRVRVESRECKFESAESHCDLHIALSCARHWATRVTVLQSIELAMQRGDTEHADDTVDRAYGRERGQQNKRSCWAWGRDRHLLHVSGGVLPIMGASLSTA